MKKRANGKEAPKARQRLRRIGQQISLGRALEQFQGVLICVDQFGFCAGLVMGVFTLMAVFLHAAHSGAEKGII